ncbi:cyclic di-AMP synthase CdaA [Lachnospiraceae bacterium]|jgi:diadenylate cyclase|nr:TIGR00159 family protein [Lachnospiraceae bacterium]NBH26398.1 TIGR00159 family protein [Lachnospiraceae bacterium]GFI15806.1 cyclic di-AMP synthase CdaA [Lachnospiraceae bacterium]GFI69410.1 cyclic di-AMP synthase CdaA [Lachnospiraceae bacterium]
MLRGLEMIETYLSRVSDIRWADVAEIIIISFLLYQMLVWIKNTKAWSLLKGILVIAVFILIAAYFEMNTILWIVKNMFGVAVTAVIVILQPELRKAIDELGRKNIISSIMPFELGKGTAEGRFSDKTINEIAKACVEMGKVKTGALIVIEQEQSLAEYERTGIDVDGIVTSQLLINIFEHNTPLHDGAVIVRGNRITSATCYLPLSDNMQLSKELGTRHRAGVGISEVTDSLTVIVSEETGKISAAYEGKLERNLNGDTLKEKIRTIQNKPEEETRKRILWKGRAKGER